jgi:hypothetical protein
MAAELRVVQGLAAPPVHGVDVGARVLAKEFDHPDVSVPRRQVQCRPRVVISPVHVDISQSE